MLWGERVTRRRALVVALLAVGIAEVVLAAAFLASTSERPAKAALPLHPVVGEFVPDGTLLHECQDQRCFEQALANIAFRDGPKAAFARLGDVYRDDANPWCHRATHAIGAGALARFGGDVTRTFAAGAPTCWSGYYHGVLERSLVNVKSRKPGPLAAVARTLCSDATPQTTAWIAYQCRHGLGHGLMITTGLSLPLSLDVCRRLATRWDRSVCKGGVFMENISPSYGVRSRWLRDDDPVYPCNAVARADKQRCYQMVTSRILPLVDNDWEEAAAVCAGVEKDFVSVCFGSLGRDASSRSGHEPEEIVETCAFARPFGGEDKCIGSAAFDMAASFANTSRAAALCDVAPVSTLDDCYWAIGTISAMSGRLLTEHESVCRSLGAAPRHVRVCIDAGGQAVPRQFGNT